MVNSHKLAQTRFFVFLFFWNEWLYLRFVEYSPVFFGLSYEFLTEISYKMPDRPTPPRSCRRKSVDVKEKWKDKRQWRFLVICQLHPICHGPLLSVWVEQPTSVRSGQRTDGEPILHFQLILVYNRNIPQTGKRAFWQVAKISKAWDFLYFKFYH